LAIAMNVCFLFRSSSAVALLLLSFTGKKCQKVEIADAVGVVTLCLLHFAADARSFAHVPFPRFFFARCAAWWGCAVYKLVHRDRLCSDRRL